MARSLVVLAGLLLGTAALAQSHMPGGMPPPSGMSLAQSSAMRFPQPVRVGDLLHRTVLLPVESQTVLGRVRQVVRDGQGTIEVVVAYGGVLGIGGGAGAGARGAPPPLTGPAGSRPGARTSCPSRS